MKFAWIIRPMKIVLGASMLSLLWAQNTTDTVKVQNGAPVIVPVAAVAVDTSKKLDAAIDSSVKKVSIADTSAVKADSVLTQKNDSTIIGKIDSLAQVSDTTKKRDSSLAVADSTVVIDSAKIKNIEPEKKEALIKSTSKKDDNYLTTRINTIDEMKGKYRSPKRALFMSLVLPGLGQAYLGNYIRATAFFGAEVGLFVGYRHYVYTLHDRQVSKYRNFADSAFSHGKYEKWVAQNIDVDPDSLASALPSRQNICSSNWSNGSDIDTACAKWSYSGDYTATDYYTAAQYDIAIKDTGAGVTPQEIGKNRRENYADYQLFYETIVNADMITGWRDVNSDEVTIVGSKLDYDSESALKKRYLNMRNRAGELARMEKYFLGGIILNHLVAGLDAAISAQRHNRRLYQEQVRWYHRVHVYSTVAMTPIKVEPTVWATLDF